MPEGKITPLGIAAATAAAAADDEDALGTFDATGPDDGAPLTPGLRC